MAKNYVTYKGFRNEIISETRIITFSEASESDQSKPSKTPTMIVELDQNAPKRLTPRYISTLLELEAKFQEKDARLMVFSNVIIERYQRYQLTSVMASRSGTVITDKLYKFNGDKFSLESTKITDNMY